MRSSALAVLLALPACIAPSVVASSGRAVAEPAQEIAWRPATAADLDGTFESERIEGEAAAALLHLWYQFAPDGRYSGAALVVGEHGPGFQTLAGTFTLTGETLDLGDGALARLSAARDRLRLESEGTTLVLKRVELR